MKNLGILFVYISLERALYKPKISADKSIKI